MANRDRWPELLKFVESDDGLVTRESGSWTEEKLFLWHRYLDIVTTSMHDKPSWPGGLVYVDLFCGPGVCSLRGSGRRLPGSPVLASTTRKPFTKILLCDLDFARLEACRSRLQALGTVERCEFFHGDCNLVAEQIASRIPRGSLTLAFIDPDALDVHFATLEHIANGRAADFLLLFATATDLVRNIDLYETQVESKLDLMLGQDSRWRDDWQALPNRSGKNVRALFPKIFERQIRTRLGYQGMRTHVIEGDKGPLYTLVYASKHERGLEFWDSIAKKELGQPRLF